MPRVSEEHLERRRQQILDAARVCFIRKGLHETSMQDIFTESGLSAGAVYRYFRSKNAIIEAITLTTIGDVRALLTRLAHQDPVPPLDETIGTVCARLMELTENDGPVRLAPQAWALALYDPEVGGHVRETVIAMRDLWALYIRRLAEAGALPADTDAEAAAKALFGLMPGFLLQHLLIGDVTPEDLRHGVRALARQSTLAAPV
ncbi:TetR/AcrR family transcriptional regulator [Actinomadura macrotermitis]|uniref:HTH-type transcriptional regulator BetI n=1 Tax=Actinomadura macrotermitis TaxID=2585200 RepID=A0A7K0BNP0_9ACTN|nr:TetR/AcrR family transcriptional regulator [Actinomadura macrotermitis]MQY02773.1 HTH-type transcriptional regulator BetI [Actinomadura macrotermitis]